MEKHNAVIVTIEGFNEDSDCALTIIFCLVSMSRRCLVQLEVSLSIARS